MLYVHKREAFLFIRPCENYICFCISVRDNEAATLPELLYQCMHHFFYDFHLIRGEFYKIMRDILYIDML